MFKVVNTLPAPKLFWLNCFIYAGIWAVAYTVLKATSDIDRATETAIISIFFAAVLFHPPIAIGWYYQYLLNMKRWLITSVLAFIFAITFIFIFNYSMPTAYAGMAHFLVGLLGSAAISISTISSASLMKQQHFITRILGLLTAIGLTLSTCTLALITMEFLAGDPYDNVFIILSCITIANSILAILNSAFFGLRKT